MKQTRNFTSWVVLFAAISAITVTAASAFDGPAASPERERELLAVLRSDAPPAEKALACKNLAVHGSVESVPDLAKLLADAELASWARIPLEVIPGAAVDAALRKSVDSLSGKLLVGAINSIGVRRDSEASDVLAGRLQDKDPEVAEAAAVALGNIANGKTATILTKALTDSPANFHAAAAEGCIRCADRMLSEGHPAEAAAIFDEVRKAKVPKQRILEATRGSILAHKPEAGIALLLEQFQSTDKNLVQIALSTYREFPGSKVDEALAAELAKAKPEHAALVIQAMADRKEPSVLPAILKAAGEGAKGVRISAINALGRIGDATCLTTLLQLALDADADLAQAARAALSDLPGENVDKGIVQQISKAEGKMFALLIDLVGQRRIDAVDDLIKAVNHSDKEVRHAALAALGNTVPAKHLSVLVTQVVSPKYPDDAKAALSALMTASVRMPDREVCAEELSAALNNAAIPTKINLLEILGAVQGTKALQTLATAAKSTDAQLQDASSKLLGEWMTIDAAPVLLDLAKTARGDKYQVRALRGYIRIARVFVMPAPQRAEMTEQAFAAAKHPAEQKMVLEVARRHPSIEMLKVAVKAEQMPELKDDAAPIALLIAQKVGAGPEVTALLAKIGFERVKLEIVKAEYGSGATQKDVTETLKKQIGDLPIVSLPAATYNGSFGGDPAPGNEKKLKIQYRINGKAGEATFAENSMILLPTPK
jgi:HEAT repeat protein